MGEQPTVVLTAWHSERSPHPDARRIDPAVLDPDGQPAWVSLFWPDRDTLPLFDDPAVQHARRSALVRPAPRAVTTATVDSTHCAGSLWVTDTLAQTWDDPFRLLGDLRLLQVCRGLLGRTVSLVGPATERYAGAPWPSGHF